MSGPQNPVPARGVTPDQAPLTRDILKPMERRIDEITRQGNEEIDMENLRVMLRISRACVKLQDYIADRIKYPEVAISREGCDVAEFKDLGPELHDIIKTILLSKRWKTEELEKVQAYTSEIHTKGIDKQRELRLWAP
ncbi:hypothetical protein MMC07_005371 [Pseudocyphellaria aurata]|nr:hypothetical protein [Pseudocyphellaria aurata]